VKKKLILQSNLLRVMKKYKARKMKESMMKSAFAFKMSKLTNKHKNN